MTNLEDEYRKRFKNQEVSTDDLGSEALWNAISSGVTQGAAVSSTGKYMWLLLGSVVITVGGILFYNSESNRSYLDTDDQSNESVTQNSKSRSEAQAKRSKSSADYSDLNENFKEQELSINEFENLVENNQTKRLSEEAITQDSERSHDSDLTQNSDIGQQSRNYDSNHSSSLVHSENQEHTSKNSIDSSRDTYGQEKPADKTTSVSDVNTSIKPDSGYDQYSHLANRTLNETGDDSVSSDLKRGADVNSKRASDTEERATELYIKNIAMKKQSLTSTEIVTSSITSNEIKIKQLEKAKLWEAKAWGGSNLTTISHQGGTDEMISQTKTDAERIIIGNSFGLGLSRSLNQNLFVSAGVEYNQLKSKFEFQSTQNTQVFAEDQLVRVWIDSSTGDTLNTEYADIWLNAVATKKTIHHNRYKRVSVPIEIGVQKRKGILEYGISGGPVINFVLSQSGRTLDENYDVASFDESTYLAPLNKTSLGLRLSPFVGINLTESLTFRLQPTFMIDSKNELGNTAINSRNIQSNLNLGLGFRF